MDSIDENIYVSSTEGITLSAPTLDASSSSAPSSSLFSSTSAPSSSVSSSLSSGLHSLESSLKSAEHSLSSSLHHAADVAKAHTPSNMAGHKATDCPFVEKVAAKAHIDVDHSASSASAPATSSSIFSSTTTTTINDSIPVSSYPPQSNDAPGADPTLEYSLPSSSHGTNAMQMKAEHLKDEMVGKVEEMGAKVEAKEHGLMESVKGGFDHVKGGYDHMKEKLHEASDSVLHHKEHSAASAGHITTTESLTSGQRKLSTESGMKAGATGTGFLNTREQGQKDGQLNDAEKQAFDKYPTKMDRSGDLDAFKKLYQSGYERGQPLNSSVDDRRYDRK